MTSLITHNHPVDLVECSSQYSWTTSNRPISQISKCISWIFHNAPFCNINVHTCFPFPDAMDVGFVEIRHECNSRAISCRVLHVHVAHASQKWVITGLDNVHGANMGPTWVLSAPDGPHVDPWTLLSGMACRLLWGNEDYSSIRHQGKTSVQKCFKLTTKCTWIYSLSFCRHFVQQEMS